MDLIGCSAGEPQSLRALLRQWTHNLENGLGTAGDDRVFGRSFLALNLSLIAAGDLSAPFLEPAEAQAFFDRMLDYVARERDLRGFDPAHGWMHTAALAPYLRFYNYRRPDASLGWRSPWMRFQEAAS